MGKGVQFSQGMRLGDILVDRGVISEEQLAQAVRYQSETGDDVGAVAGSMSLENRSVNL